MAEASRSIEADVAVDRRGAPRHAGVIRVMISGFREPVPADMVDVSLTGCRLRCRTVAGLPAASLIWIPTLAFAVQAERVWARGTVSGWRFVYNPRQTAAVRAAVARVTRAGRRRVVVV